MKKNLIAFVVLALSASAAYAGTETAAPKACASCVTTDEQSFAAKLNEQHKAAFLAMSTTEKQAVIAAAETSSADEAVAKVLAARTAK